MQKLQLATDKFDPEFIERRRQGLEVGLENHPILSIALFIPITALLLFLQMKDTWQE